MQQKITVVLFWNVCEVLLCVKKKPNKNAIQEIFSEKNVDLRFLF